MNILNMQAGKYEGPGVYDVEKLPKIQLNLTKSVPFISLSQAEGVGPISEPAGQDYNLALVSIEDYGNLDAKAKVRVCGLMVENEFLEDGTTPNPEYTGVYDRFDTIALMQSTKTRKEFVLVYDNLTGRLFVMPPIYNLIDSVTERLAGSSTIALNGYYVGAKQTNNGLVGGAITATDARYKLKSKDPLVTKTHVMAMEIVGFDASHIDTYGQKEQRSQENYFETTDVATIELVSIGASADIFEDGKALCTRPFNVESGVYSPVYLSKVDVSDLLIPLFT